MARIFIAYARKYELFAAQLARSLSQIGAEVWLDVEHIPAGMKWHQAIEHGLERCELMLLIVTPESMESANVEAEWFYFLSENKPVIPLLYRYTKIHYRLRPLQYIDFERQPYEVAFNQLHRELLGRGLYLRQQPPPMGASRPPRQSPLPGTRRSRNPIVRFIKANAREVMVGLFVTVVGGLLLAVLTSVLFSNTPEAGTRSGLVQNATETLAPLPSDTPSPQPTVDSRSGFTPVTRNADWTPEEQEFALPQGGTVTMVLVPAGSFEMGSTDAEIDFAVALCNAARQDGETCPESFFTDETPTSIQEFAEPFWIDRTEVTRAQYQVCVDAGVCEETPDRDFSTDADQPINHVTWFQAQPYCEWRGERTRLPTEAEWEYAARGPDRLIFPWGNEFDGSLANHCDSNCADANWASNSTYTNPSNNDGFEVTAPVGSFPGGASWVGALDLSGNLREWTSSLYEGYPYSDNHESNSNTSSTRVLRGGSFSSAADDLRSANRIGISPIVFGYYDYGFRCARSYP